MLHLRHFTRITCPYMPQRSKYMCSAASAVAALPVHPPQPKPHKAASTAVYCMQPGIYTYPSTTFQSYPTWPHMASFAAHARHYQHDQTSALPLFPCPGCRRYVRADCRASRRQSSGPDGSRAEQVASSGPHFLPRLPPLPGPPKRPPSGRLGTQEVTRGSRPIALVTGTKGIGNWPDNCAHTFP